MRQGRNAPTALSPSVSGSDVEELGGAVHRWLPVADARRSYSPWAVFGFHWGRAYRLALAIFLAAVIGRAVSQPFLTGVAPRTMAINFFNRRRNIALALTGIFRPLSGALVIQDFPAIALFSDWRTAFRYPGFFTRGSSPGVLHPGFFTRGSSPGVLHPGFFTRGSSPGVLQPGAGPANVHHHAAPPRGHRPAARRRYAERLFHSNILCRQRGHRRRRAC